MAEKEENVHRDHRKRMKAQLLHDGLDGCNEHQLLEALLFYSLPLKDTNPIAHQLLNRFGSISDVLDASVEQLCEISGIKENSALLIKLSAQLTKRYWQEQQQDKKKPVFDSVQSLGQYLIPQFIGTNDERLYLLCLDNKATLLGFDLISKGSVDKTNIDYRLILEKVIKYKATGIVLAHNHPRSPTSPSNEDIQATIYIRNALAVIDVELVDHIIVSGRQFASMQQLAYL